MIKMLTEEAEHGVTAYYAGGPGEPYYQPVMDCLCGFSTGRCADWESAGRDFDRHFVGETPIALP